VWLYGRPSGRPTFLVVTGIFADASTMDHFPRVFPQFDVLRAHLPGNHSPQLSETSVEAFSAALDDALRQVVSAPLAVLGLSVGALVAMGVRHPQLCGLLLVEPPLRTLETWPLEDPSFMAADAELMGAILGRDFSHLARGLAVPTEVLAGGVSLMPRRSLERMPSLVDDGSRALLAAHPLITLTVADEAGHNVQNQATARFGEALYRLADRLAAASR
jgi:pimeloyl-ACP methyl ester carboxylesterase